MRRAVNVLAWLSLIFTLSGCGLTEFRQQNGAADAKISLRIAWWGSQIRNETTIEVIKRYEREHPHVEIEFDYSAFNEYWKKLSPSAAGNVLPDIVQMDVSYLTQYASLDLLEDLDPYVENGLIDTTHIHSSKLAGGRLNGRLYGFSLGVNALYSVYDPEVFKKNGIKPPHEEWTWEDLDVMGEQLQGSGIYLGTALTPEQFFAYYLRQNGASLFAADGTGLGYRDDKLFVEYFGRMQRLAVNKLIFSPDIWTLNINRPEKDPFYKGGALLGWGYSNQFISTSQKYGKPLVMAPLPGPYQSKGLFLKPGMFFSIAKSSKSKEEAAKFINYFVNNLEANKVLKGERGVPVSSAVQEQLKPYLEPVEKQVFDYIEWVEKHSSAMDPAEPVGASEVTAVLRELYDLLLFNKITPEKAAAEFRIKAENILKNNGPALSEGN